MLKTYWAIFHRWNNRKLVKANYLEIKKHLPNFKSDSWKCTVKILVESIFILFIVLFLVFSVLLFTTKDRKGGNGRKHLCYVLLSFEDFLDLFILGVLMFTYIYVYHMCVWCLQRLGMELQVVDNNYVGTVIKMWVLWKRSQFWAISPDLVTLF